MLRSTTIYGVSSMVGGMRRGERSMSDESLEEALIRNIRREFLKGLQRKTGWGRNELELMFERSVSAGLAAYTKELADERREAGD